MASGVPLLSEGGRLFLDEGRTARMRRESAVCRAYFKLEEALRVAGVRVGGGWTCLDIGASPGGWSQEWVASQLPQCARPACRCWAWPQEQIFCHSTVAVNAVHERLEGCEGRLGSNVPNHDDTQLFAVKISLRTKIMEQPWLQGLPRLRVGVCAQRRQQR